MVFKVGANMRRKPATYGKVLNKSALGSYNQVPGVDIGAETSELYQHDEVLRRTRKDGSTKLRRPEVSYNSQATHPIYSCTTRIPTNGGFNTMDGQNSVWEGEFTTRGCVQGQNSSLNELRYPHNSPTAGTGKKRSVRKGDDTVVDNHTQDAGFDSVDLQRCTDTGSGTGEESLKTVPDQYYMSSIPNGLRPGMPKNIKLYQGSLAKQLQYVINDFDQWRAFKHSYQNVSSDNSSSICSLPSDCQQQTRRAALALSEEVLPSEMEHADTMTVVGSVSMLKINPAIGPKESYSIDNHVLPHLNKDTSTSVRAISTDGCMKAERPITTHSPSQNEGMKLIRLSRSKLSQPHLHGSSANVLELSSSFCKRLTAIEGKSEIRRLKRRKIKDRLHDFKLERLKQDFCSREECKVSGNYRYAPFNDLDPNTPLNTPRPTNSSQISGKYGTVLRTITGVKLSSSKVTYARQRTYLNDDSTEAAVQLRISKDIDFSKEYSPTSHTVDLPGLATTLSYARIDAGKIQLDNPQKNVLRSIHELRDAGENERLLGETETILDDLNDPRVSLLPLKRNQLLSLTLKLQTLEYRRRFADSNFEARFLMHIGSNTDEIVIILLLIALLYLVEGPRSLHALALLTCERVATCLGGLLNDTGDILAIAGKYQSSVSRGFQEDLIKLCESVHGSSSWQFSQLPRLTLRTLSLQCLECLVRHVRKAGSTFNVVSQDMTERLLDMIISCQSVPPAKRGLVTAADLRLALLILEASTTIQPAARNVGQYTWTSHCIEKAAHLFCLIKDWPQNEIENWLINLKLRLCLNLTNNDTVACKIFSRSEVIDVSLSVIKYGFRNRPIEESEEYQALQFESLILTLGLLINLAELSETARNLIVAPHSERDGYLDELMRHFLFGLKRSSKVKEINVHLERYGKLIASRCSRQWTCIKT